MGRHTYICIPDINHWQQQEQLKQTHIVQWEQIKVNKDKNEIPEVIGNPKKKKLCFKKRKKKKEQNQYKIHS